MEGEVKGEGVRGEGILLCLCALAGLTVIHLKSRRSKISTSQ